MFSENELELWKLRLGFGKGASDLIDTIRNSEPVRLVRGGGGRSVTGRYPSQKMGRTIQFESHTCELPFILLCEFSNTDSALEYWDQPFKLPVTYKNLQGRIVRTNLFPDFFLINSNSAEFVECKPEEMLIKLAVEQPNKFCLDARGRWHCPPGEEAAKKYGIGYRIFSTEEIDRTFYRNIVFLEDYLLNDVQDIAKIVIDRLTELVSSEEGLNLSTLLALAEKIGATADDVYQLIANGLLYTDLRREALVNRSRVFVYTSQQVASTKKNLASYPKAMFVELKIGERIQWGNNLFEIVNLDQYNVWLIGEINNHPTVSLEHFEQLVKKGEIAAVPNTEKPSSALPWEELCNKAAPKERQEAQRRFDILMKHYQKIPLSQNVSQRTLARWSGYYKRAELLYGNGFIGLIPKWAERGDRSTQRLNPIVLNLMNELIENDYERNVQSSMFVVYGKLRLACKEKRETPPSYMTFVRHIRKRPLHKQELKRKGSRAAYNSEPLYFFLEKDTPRHGDRPFEVCHIDHTLSILSRETR